MRATGVRVEPDGPFGRGATEECNKSPVPDKSTTPESKGRETQAQTAEGRAEKRGSVAISDRKTPSMHFSAQLSRLNLSVFIFDL